MKTSLETRNNIMKWIFVQIIIILSYLSNWNGFVAKKNQLGNFEIEHIHKWEPLWGTRSNITKWIFVQIILILNYLSNWNGFFAKRESIREF